jgi:hypothetical protein
MVVSWRTRELGILTEGVKTRTPRVTMMARVKTGRKNWKKSFLGFWTRSVAKRERLLCMEITY